MRLAVLLATLIALSAAPARASDLLVTGDSLSGIVGDTLHDDLTPIGLTVHRDPQPGTGLTKPFILDWEQYAQQQVTTYAPSAVVMALGANDDHPLPGVKCCGPRWIDQYARRVDGMIATYTGTGRIYWMTLAAPPIDRPKTRRGYVAANRAIRRAVHGHPDVARVVNVSEVVSPGFVYREEIDGEPMRQPDRIHLSQQGARRVANVIEAQMRADGVF